MQNESCIWNKTLIVALLFKPLLLLFFFPGTMGFYAPNSCVHHVYLEGVHCSGKSLEDKNLEVQDYSVGAGTFIFFLSSSFGQHASHIHRHCHADLQTLYNSNFSQVLSLIPSILLQKFSIARQHTGHATILHPMILSFLNLLLFWPLIRSLSEYCVQLCVNHCHSSAPG